MFRDREDAGLRLAQALKERKLHDPLVLGIPRGGGVVGAVLAQELGADLDVTLARKLRAPGQEELALGAVAESGAVFVNPEVRDYFPNIENYLQAEQDHQMQEIARRARLFRAVRPAAPVAGRSVIVTDDGIATGSTMVAALRAVRAQQPRELIVAAPVAPPERLVEIGKLCDAIVCLETPANFYAVGQFYQNFEQVEDEQVLDLLRAFMPACPHALGR